MKPCPFILIIAGSLLVLGAITSHSRDKDKAIQTPTTTPYIGYVVDESGKPVEGATVRIQTEKGSTTTNLDGSFILFSHTDKQPVTISAWKEGYYCSSQENVEAGQVLPRLVLRKYQITDNPEYAWVPPEGTNSCYSCKPTVTQVWLNNDAHGKSAKNPRFLTMYYGTNLSGQTSPLTRYVTTQDYGRMPLPPDTSRPYYGPGFKLDFPESNGNCSTCHIPGAALADAYGVDPNSVTGVDTYGIHCDFCHKIADTSVKENSLPDPGMPGVLSLDIRRPFPDDKDRYQLFFGTFDDDNVPKEDTKLPLLSESRYCASCHYGVFWDTQIYNSYGEWLASSHSNPVTGRTCQQCHMPSPTILNGITITNVAEGKGGVNRDPDSIHAHTFPGAASQELLQNALTLTTSARRMENNNAIRVDVRLYNDRTGHHIPTDSPLRQMILLVRAYNSSGQPLTLIQGATLPDWTGVGNPEDGYYAGLPGKGYAKILSELWTGISPTGAYWNPTRLESDTRLPARTSDDSTYLFSASPSSPVTVDVQVWFRRAYRSLADLKGWKDPDILMESSRMIVK